MFHLNHFSIFWTRKPNAGSFVRINKTKPRALFSQALHDRYLNYEGADDRLLNELKEEMNAPFLELVGLDKIGRKQRYKFENDSFM